ncbi:hypothetical protein [Tannerella sp.]|uniref:hypothetical protein n=1 Tax=Tannerella sp. TaxID=2382127 RepID=UPI0026DBF07C|nr:hypothetical protein [Tannerella sp.]MDO4703636.1 hypothetical protein [Tannerella sp.]
MTCAELYQLMETPAMLSEKTLPELKQIAEDFPYFHAVQMLYLKNLQATNDLRLNLELKKRAVCVPDRTQLFLWLEGACYEKQPRAQTVEAKDGTTQSSPVDEYLSDPMDETETESSKPLFEPSASLDYMRWLTDKDTDAATPKNKLRHQDLIDSFIESGNERIGRLTPEQVGKDHAADGEKPEQQHATEADHDTLDDSYFTETLAHVYIRQKRYEKALEIIKSLSLKYPKKNIYFADQIRFLEKLIIHSKQKI